MTLSGSPADPHEIDQALQDAWRKVWEVSEPAARGWLSSTRPIALHDSLLVLAVPNEYTRDRLEARLRPSIEAQLTSYFGLSVQLAITIDPTTQTTVPAGHREAPAPVGRERRGEEVPGVGPVEPLGPRPRTQPGSGCPT